MVRRRCLMLAALVLFVLPLAALAAGEATATGEVEAAETRGDSLFAVLVIGGGPIGWVIILLSLVSLALIAEHFWSIRRGTLCPPEILGMMDVLFAEQDYEGAMAVAETDSSCLARVLEAGLAMVPDRKAMETTMATALDRQETKLRRKISYLGLIGELAPLIGLLGTVLGMMVGFSEISSSTGMPKPSHLARTVKVSLGTTFLGFFAAIPALSAFSFFQNRVEAALAEVTTITGELLQSLRSRDDLGDDGRPAGG